MKVVVCWSHFSGYMAACWRALAQTPGVSVFVLAFEPERATPFDAKVLAGIPHRLLKPAERHDAAVVRNIVAEQSPDRLMIGAWNNPAYRAVAADDALAGVRKTLCIDTNFRNDWRQAIGKRLLRSYLRRFDTIAVPGERAAAYAAYLGFGPAHIRRGLYGIDYAAFAGCRPARLQAGDWPRRFLFVGRYAPEKAIDVLTDGYARYRASTPQPWSLVCCGSGVEAHRLTGAGVTDVGFVQPADQPALFASAGAFVLASRYEPWGVAVAEAAAAGLPLVLSEACGAGPELLRDGHNGYRFGTDDAAGLASAMTRIAEAPLPEWGERSCALAEAFDARTWPGRMGFVTPE